MGRSRSECSSQVSSRRSDPQPGLQPPRRGRSSSEHMAAAPRGSPKSTSSPGGRPQSARSSQSSHDPGHKADHDVLSAREKALLPATAQQNGKSKRPESSGSASGPESRASGSRSNASSAGGASALTDIVGKYARRNVQDEACKCGNIYLGDALFCRKCGLQRPQVIPTGMKHYASRLTKASKGYTGYRPGVVAEGIYGKTSTKSISAGLTELLEYRDGTHSTAQHLMFDHLPPQQERFYGPGSYIPGYSGFVRDVDSGNMIGKCSPRAAKAGWREEDGPVPKSVMPCSQNVYLASLRQPAEKREKTVTQRERESVTQREREKRIPA